MMAGADRSRRSLRPVIAAIDFGTMRCCCPYGFVSDLDKRPPEIFVLNHFQPGETPGISVKTAASLLFNPQKLCHSFGSVADSKYSDLFHEGNHNDWFYFKHFNKILRIEENMQIGKNTTIADAGGKQMEAITVFCAAFKFLKNRFLEYFSPRTNLKIQDMNLVITVPAPCAGGAEWFLNEAAQNAGIDEDNLIIAMEPDAVSMYCQLPQLQAKIIPEDRSCLQIPSVAAEGSQFMLIDISGHSGDIKVFERQSHSSFKMVTHVSSHLMGGDMVDKEFERLISQIVGGEIFNLFQENNPSDIKDFMSDFTRKKRCRQDDNSVTSLKFPLPLQETLHECTSYSLRDVVAFSEYATQIKVVTDKLRIDADLVISWFRPTIDSIVDHAKQLFCHPDVRNANLIIMLGGFSDSPLLQEKMTSSFQDKIIVIPSEPSTALALGAVMYGALITGMIEGCS